MRTFAAGTFALNCARLGIPCIGWGNSNPDAPAQGCDTQRILFPELTVPIGDMNSAQRVAQSLKKDDVFYNHVSAYAKHMYEKEFSEAVFLERFKSFFSRYL